MNEGEFIQRLRGILPKCLFTRIETSTMSGVFDINILRNGQELWIETKVSEGQRFRLRSHQYSWWTVRRINHGLAVVVAWTNLGEKICVWNDPPPPSRVFDPDKESATVELDVASADFVCDININGEVLWKRLIRPASLKTL